MVLGEVISLDHSKHLSDPLNILISQIELQVGEVK